MEIEDYTPDDCRCAENDREGLCGGECGCDRCLEDYAESQAADAHAAVERMMEER